MANHWGKKDSQLSLLKAIRHLFFPWFKIYYPANPSLRFIPPFFYLTKSCPSYPCPNTTTDLSSYLNPSKIAIYLFALSSFCSFTSFPMTLYSLLNYRFYSFSAICTSLYSTGLPPSYFPTTFINTLLNYLPLNLISSRTVPCKQRDVSTSNKSSIAYKSNT